LMVFERYLRETAFRCEVWFALFVLCMVYVIICFEAFSCQFL